jgi:hypothetical protein
LVVSLLYLLLRVGFRNSVTVDRTRSLRRKANESSGFDVDPVGLVFARVCNCVRARASKIGRAESA